MQIGAFRRIYPTRSVYDNSRGFSDCKPLATGQMRFTFPERHQVVISCPSSTVS